MLGGSSLGASKRWVLSVGQAQKEFTVNEALQTLDVVVGGAVEEPPRADPPPTPALGARYIVVEDATGAWAGESHCVVAWTSGGWRFIRPVEATAAFTNGGWEMGLIRGSAVLIDGGQVVGASAAAIESPAGGSLIDSEARVAIEPFSAHCASTA
jgi:hypothetical protein